VKSINYKLSISAYLKLGETTVFVIFFFPFALSLPLPLTLCLLSNSFFHSTSFSRGSARMRACVRADLQMLHGRGPIRIRAYITPVRVHHFCSLSPLALVGVVGFSWQRPFRLAKGEGVTSILRGISLSFLQSKNSRVVFTLFILVYSVMQVFM
jgi:hypothetical protein